MSSCLVKSLCTSTTQGWLLDETYIFRGSINHPLGGAGTLLLVVDIWMIQTMKIQTFFFLEQKTRSWSAGLSGSGGVNIPRRFHPVWPSKRSGNVGRKSWFLWNAVYIVESSSLMNPYSASYQHPKCWWGFCDHTKPYTHVLVYRNHTHTHKSPDTARVLHVGS